jgi:hypothetical protein
MKITYFELAVESVCANDKAIPGCAARTCVITGMAVGRDSFVGLATRYGLDGPEFESRRGARNSASVQTGLEAHRASCTMATGSFPGVKRPGRGVDHPHLAPRLKKE